MVHAKGPFVFRDRVALITGAASGIGACLAREFAARGAHLALADNQAESLAALTRELHASGARVLAQVCDVADGRALAGLAHAVHAEYGALHLLVNNAGVALMGTFEETSSEDFEWLLSINLLGPIRLTRECLPLLRAADDAHIVNISSVFGLIAPPGQSAYCTAKFGVRGFSEALRHELVDSGVGVTCVHPGGVRTQIAEAARIARSIDPEFARASKARFAALAKTTPESAALQIAQAIQARRGRLLIGSDARVLDWMQRLRPTHYWRSVAKLFRPATRPASAARR